MQHTLLNLDMWRYLAITSLELARSLAFDANALFHNLKTISKTENNQPLQLQLQANGGE